VQVGGVITCSAPGAVEPAFRSCLTGPGVAARGNCYGLCNCCLLFRAQTRIEDGGYSLYSSCWTRGSSSSAFSVAGMPFFGCRPLFSSLFCLISLDTYLYGERGRYIPTLRCCKHFYLYRFSWAGPMKIRARHAHLYVSRLPLLILCVWKYCGSLLNRLCAVADVLVAAFNAAFRHDGWCAVLPRRAAP